MTVPYCLIFLFKMGSRYSTTRHTSFIRFSLLSFNQSPVHNLLHQGIFMEPADGNSLAGNAQFIALDKIDFVDGDDKGFVHFDEM